MSNVTFLLLTGVIGVGILILLIKYWYAKLYFKYSLESNNTAYAIYLAAQLISFGILFSAILEPLVVLNTMLSNASGDASLMETLQYSGLFISIVTMIYIVLVAISNFLYKYFSKSENGIFEEIRANKIAAAAITGIILISMVIIFYAVVGKIVTEFIPYPDVPRIF